MFKIALKPPGQDEPQEVALQQVEAEDRHLYNIHLQDRCVTAHIDRQGPGEGWIRMQGRIAPFKVFRRDNQMLVWVNGRNYTIEIVERTAQRASGAQQAHVGRKLKAPMPGTVLKININPGDTYEAGDALIIMESMKMEMTLAAPTPGTVNKLRCDVGDMVDMNQTLAELEPADEQEDAS